VRILRKKLINSEIIFSLIMILVALFFFVFSLNFPPGTSDGVPGPKYFPMLLATMLFILSVVSIVVNYGKKENYFIWEKIKSNFKPLLKVVVAFIVFVVMWKYIPFYISALIFLLILSHIFKLRMRTAILYSVVLTGLLFIMFTYGFGISLEI
jgi:putative tricarboxylic transport membrane protein